MGIDWDGTVTDYPQVISSLVHIVGPKNCYLITGRHPGSIMRTLEEAEQYGFPIGDLAGSFFYPKEYDYEKLGVEPGLWESLIEFKVKICREHKIDILIEDDPRYKAPLEAVGVSVILVGDKWNT